MKHLLVALVLVAGCGGGGSGDDIATVCGNGLVEGTEQCDDGNIASGDGCSTACVREPRCGDAIIDSNEQCDDGNVASGDGCSATCVLECGNGVLDTGEQCDDGNHKSFDGCSATCTTEASYRIMASWQFRNFAGATQACPTGFDTAAVYAQPIDSAGNNVGSPIIDLFTCANGSGTTADLFQGRYKVYIGITNTTGTITYATTPTTPINLTMNQTLSVTIYTDAGYFGWAWQLVGAMTNNTLTCAQAGATGGVELLSTLSMSTMSFDDIFDCEGGTGVTAALPVGSYTVSISALNANDQSIGTAPALTNKQIMAPNKVTDLGTVMIPIDGK